MSWDFPLPLRAVIRVGFVRTPRARLAYGDDTGQPIEEWIATAIVVRAIPTGGAAAFDWHAIRVMCFRTPNGKLDANEKQ